MIAFVGISHKCFFLVRRFKNLNLKKFWFCLDQNEKKLDAVLELEKKPWKKRICLILKLSVGY